MLKISEIVKKTEKMFDLFNQYFYSGELTRLANTVSPDGGAAHTVGAASMKSGMQITNFTGKSIFVPNLDRPITEYYSEDALTFHTIITLKQSAAHERGVCLSADAPFLFNGSVLLSAHRG